MYVMVNGEKLQPHVSHGLRRVSLYENFCSVNSIVVHITVIISGAGICFLCQKRHRFSALENGGENGHEGE